MALDLDRLEQRIVGVLIEKQMTVPDTYPLTVNALLHACNQKSNRDPQLEVEAYEVEGALRSLLDKGWAREMDLAGGRTLRYEHTALDQLGVAPSDLALLAELLLRGPQSPGELKIRASRMHPFASPGEVEARLGALADRPVPYVEQLPRRPREHAARWAHRLGRAEREEALPPVQVAGPGRAEAPGPSRAPAPSRPVAMDADDRLAGRLEHLTVLLESVEERLQALEDRLARLEGR